MATWEDGPEYAPHERPQYFADAPLPPLEQAPPVERPADGHPADRPRFDEPSAPVAPLATLVPQPPDERDPERPFDVVTATLTTQSAWGSAPTEPFVATAPLGPAPVPDRTGGVAPWSPSPAPGVAGAVPGAAGSAPGATGSAPGPYRTDGPTGPRPPDPYAYPAPGTPGWFAPPPPTYGEQRGPGRVDARRVVEAATPGLCVCLAIGGLVYVLSPVMLVVAVVLSTRVRVAQRAVRLGFRIAAGAAAFFAVVGLYRSAFAGEPWWGFVGLWSLLICWVMLGVLLLLVWQALTRPAPPPDPWG